MALISATLLASNQLGGSSRLQQPGPERKFEDEVPSDDRRDEFTQRRVGEGDDAVAGAGALSDKPWPRPVLTRFGHGNPNRVLRVREILTHSQLPSARRVLLTGCGIEVLR